MYAFALSEFDSTMRRWPLWSLWRPLAGSEQQAMQAIHQQPLNQVAYTDGSRKIEFATGQQSMRLRCFGGDGKMIVNQDFTEFLDVVDMVGDFIEGKFW